jgi:hypothetical protein
VKAQFAHVQWGRVVFAGVAAPAISVGLVMLTIAAYALQSTLRADLDGEMVGRFAMGVAPAAGPLLLLLFTAFASQHVASTARSNREVQGLLVGIVAGLVTILVQLVGGSLLSLDLIGFSLTAGAGWIGTAVGVRS